MWSLFLTTKRRSYLLCLSNPNFCHRHAYPGFVRFPSLYMIVNDGKLAQLVCALISLRLTPERDCRTRHRDKAHHCRLGTTGIAHNKRVVGLRATSADTHTPYTYTPDNPRAAVCCPPWALLVAPNVHQVGLLPENSHASRFFVEEILRQPPALASRALEPRCYSTLRKEDSNPGLARVCGLKLQPGESTGVHRWECSGVVR